MQAIKPDTSRKLANMSFLCAILVVCIHIQRPEGCDFWLIKWLSGGVSQIAVPFFFMASGYFLLNHHEERGWWISALKKRVNTLLVPFFSLNLFWFPIIYTFHAIGVKYFHADNSNRTMEFTFVNFLKGINILPVFGGPILGVLWYVRALLLLVIISPLLLWLIKRSKWIGAVVVTTIYVAWMLQTNFLPWMSYELSLRCLFFFTFGMLVRLYNFEKANSTIGVATLTIGVALMIACKNVYIGSAFKPVLGSTYTIALIIGIWSLMPAVRLPDFFSNKSFAIYVPRARISSATAGCLACCGWQLKRASARD